MIKTFENFNSDFTFDEILQDLRDEFRASFEYHDRSGNVHKVNLNEFHDKMKYDISKDGIWYCIHTRITDIEGYKKAYPIFLEIIDRIVEKNLYPKNIYFYSEDKRSARQYKKIPDPSDKSIPEIFSSIKLYFCVIPEKEMPKRSFGWRAFSKIMGYDHYRDLEFGSSGDGEDPEEFSR